VISCGGPPFSEGKRRKRGSLGHGRFGGMAESSGGRGNCSQDVLYEREKRKESQRKVEWEYRFDGMQRLKFQNTF
ncbi:hypothetical protein ACQP3D_29900, partial [Escherichia coli]